jgi:hypothetical protein
MGPIVNLMEDAVSCEIQPLPALERQHNRVRLEEEIRPWSRT